MRNDLYNLVDQKDFSKEDLKAMVKELSYKLYQEFSKSDYEDIITEVKSQLVEDGVLND